MNTYCVWFDNFFQELFALEKIEFDNYKSFQQCLHDEKNIIHYINAESMIQAFEIYRKKIESTTIISSSHLVH